MPGRLTLRRVRSVRSSDLGVSHGDHLSHEYRDAYRIHSVCGCRDQVVKTYQYGPNSGPNICSQRGFRGKRTARPIQPATGYDIYGNKMSETEPLQASRPVHKRAEETRTDSTPLATEASRTARVIIALLLQRSCLDKRANVARGIYTAYIYNVGGQLTGIIRHVDPVMSAHRVRPREYAGQLPPTL